MTTINIFVTGATGYIGGSILSTLLSDPRSDRFKITALVHEQEKASLFRPLRVTAQVGSYDDSALLTKLASQADIVIACANADHLGGAKAILSGLKDRHQHTKTTPVLIHTSGIEPFADTAGGDHVSDLIYLDYNLHQYEYHNPRPVDIAIADAGEEGYVKTCIVFPSLTFGIAKTILASLKIQNTRTSLMVSIIKADIERRQGGVVGKGLNIWSLVHIEDLVHLYMQIFDAAIDSRPFDSGRRGIYYAENGDCVLGEIFHKVTQELSSKGIGTSSPTPFTPEELQKYTFTHLLGGNARFSGERARATGWKPVHPARSILDTIHDEVAASLDGGKVGLN